VGVATAGASHVVLISRNEARLRETAEAVANLSQGAKVSVYQADVTDDAAVKKIADAVGTWDAILHCAGYVNKPTPVASADLEDYWKAFEVSPTNTYHILETRY
jgi:NAD(P)-dependent dehydrogenase (short-subunit alcohol dehydrogenase family)